MNGKGDKWRKTNFKIYREAFDDIFRKVKLPKEAFDDIEENNFQKSNNVILKINKFKKKHDFIGCADSGFCSKCLVIVSNPTCFCAGGFCPECNNFVAARSIPENLNGIYRKYSSSLPTCLVEYQNGQYKGIVNENV